VEITKNTECRRLKSPSGKPGLDLVIVGPAIVIAGLDLTSPLLYQGATKAMNITKDVDKKGHDNVKHASRLDLLSFMFEPMKIVTMQKRNSRANNAR
jgi:hypothetical protein